MEVDRQASFIKFVYPFLFEEQTLDQRREAIESAQWQGRKQALDVWVRSRFPKDDLLAHVERYLNPPEGTPATALLWEINNNVLRVLPKLGGVDWILSLKSPRKDIPFHLETIQIALFRGGVGFVIFQVKLLTEQYEDWLDFLHYFRFVRREETATVRAPSRVNEEQTCEHVFGEVLEAVLHTAVEKQDAWWREVFVPGQLIPFAVLYLDTEDVAEDQIGKLLYRVRNFFPSEREIVPTAEDLRLDHSSLLCYAWQQWFVFSLEGGAFVSVNAPRNTFFRQTLRDHLRDQYFLLFLLALYQKFMLLSLSQMVSEHWIGEDEKQRRRAFERLRNRLLDFTARGYFAQVMQREHHHKVYCKWQEIFHLERLYKEVSDEVREMHGQLTDEQTRRLEQRLNLLGALIGVPALMMSFLSINLYGITAEGEGLSLWTALLLSVLSFGVGGLVWLLLSRRV